MGWFIRLSDPANSKELALFAHRSFAFGLLTAHKGLPRNLMFNNPILLSNNATTVNLPIGAVRNSCFGYEPELPRITGNNYQQAAVVVPDADVSSIIYNLLLRIQSASANRAELATLPINLQIVSVV